MTQTRRLKNANCNLAKRGSANHESGFKNVSALNLYVMGREKEKEKEKEREREREREREGERERERLLIQQFTARCNKSHKFWEMPLLVHECEGEIGRIKTCVKLSEQSTSKLHLEH